MLHPYYVYNQLGWRKILPEPSTENNTFKKKSESKQQLLLIGGKYLRIGNGTLRLVTRQFEHFSLIFTSNLDSDVEAYLIRL